MSDPLDLFESTPFSRKHFSAEDVHRTDSFAEAATILSRYFSGTPSVLRAPTEMAELWIERRIAPVIKSLPQEFLDDYKEWHKNKHDEEGGFVMHVLVDSFVPEIMMGVVLARINENSVTLHAWAIPSMDVRP